MKALSISSLFVASLFLQGCDTSATPHNKSLKTFLSLHTKYCAADYASVDKLISALNKDSKFVVSDNYEGIYEKSIADLSYAISPEEGGCTTDLKLSESSTGKPYFGFDEINAALLAVGYKLKGNKKVRTELGLDNQELKVIEQKYTSVDNKTSTLVFPLEHEDQYFMTLFVEKFEVQGASLKVNTSSLVEI